MIAITPATFENDIPRDIAARAHAGTSFVPEQRADQERRSYAAQLALDFEALAKYANTDDKRATLAAEFERYRDGYRTRYLAMLAAKSRCMSTMITGGANFPVSRNRKRSDAADKRTTELVEYRKRALDAIRKTLQPELRPVMSGDSDAIDRLTAKIAKDEAVQAQMKAVNKAIRDTRRAGTAAQVAALIALNIPGIGTEDAARGLLKPDAFGNVGFAAFELTNNNANIRRNKARLAQISKAKSTEAVELVGDRARFEDIPADNRVRLYFPGKPDAATRGRLKSRGFRWAPSMGCWQAYRNTTSLAVARREAGICEKCGGTGGVYTAGQVTVECDACAPSDSNYDGVCVTCLGPEAITPEGV